VPDNLTALLRLQQFADSALPIGGGSHSFGLESLVDCGLLDSNGIESFFLAYLEEAGALEAAFCAASCGRESRSMAGIEHRAGRANATRESRDASASMGRRFLDWRLAFPNCRFWFPQLDWTTGSPCSCFGLVAEPVFISQLASAAYLNNRSRRFSAASACSAGQTRAHQILWDLKPVIVCAVGAPRTFRSAV
jgi:urease accessory protein UreF